MIKRLEKLKVIFLLSKIFTIAPHIATRSDENPMFAATN